MQRSDGVHFESRRTGVHCSGIRRTASRRLALSRLRNTAAKPEHLRNLKGRIRFGHDPSDAGVKYLEVAANKTAGYETPPVCNNEKRQFKG